MTEIENSILKFIEPFYQKKDMMHNLTHIERVLSQAKNMLTRYPDEAEVVTYAAYFHGLVEHHLEAVNVFLKTLPLTEILQEEIVQCAIDSNKSALPKTLAGKILHDAHLLEGGKTFGVVKSLITGSLRGQSLQETITYYNMHLAGKFQCALPENQPLLAEREAFAKALIEDLQENL